MARVCIAKASEPEPASLSAYAPIFSAASCVRYFFFCSGFPQRSKALFTRVFCTSTRTPTDASIRESSSTARMAWKNEPPAPPYSSGVSMPIKPTSKHCFSSAGSRCPCSSIASTRLRISPSANSRTLVRNICSSSESVVSGRANDSSTAVRV